MFTIVILPIHILTTLNVSLFQPPLIIVEWHEWHMSKSATIIISAGAKFTHAIRENSQVQFVQRLLHRCVEFLVARFREVQSIRQIVLDVIGTEYTGEMKDLIIFENVFLAIGLTSVYFQSSTLVFGKPDS